MASEEPRGKLGSRLLAILLLLVLIPWVLGLFIFLIDRWAK
jgi:hypothetical protein